MEIISGSGVEYKSFVSKVGLATVSSEYVSEKLVLENYLNVP